MQKKYYNLQKKFLRDRQRKLANWSSLFEKFVNDAVSYLGKKVTLILIGSRARGDYESYSDFDLVVFYDSIDEEKLFEVLNKLRPKGVPIELITVHISAFDDPLIQKMLKGGKVLHNGLNLGLDNL